MSYVGSTSTAVARRQNNSPTIDTGNLPALGLSFSGLTAGAASGSPVGIAAGVLSLFGGSDRPQKVPLHKAMIQQMYNGAVQGDVTFARKLLWCITGDYDENKPFAAGLWQQLAQTAPKVYTAAMQAGAWPQPKGVDIDINSPAVPNPSMTGGTPVNPATGFPGSSTGAGLGGISTPVLLAVAGLGAILLFKRK